MTTTKLFKKSETDEYKQRIRDAVWEALDKGRWQRYKVLKQNVMLAIEETKMAIEENMRLFTCDECENTATVDDGEYPDEWIIVERLSMSGDGEDISVSDDNDPQFCCRACAEKWLEEQLDTVTGEVKAKKKK